MIEDTPATALLNHAAHAPLPGLGWLRVTGEDRVRWLNGMATNSIQALQPGQGCYNFFLNAQGRIQGDATVFLLEDCLLLETAAERLPALKAMLDRFIIMDDVELAPVEHRAGLLLAGPEAEALLGRLGLPAPAENMLVRERWQGEELTLIHAHSPLVPRFECWSDAATIGLLAEVLRDAGSPEATQLALEDLRILEGTPLFGTDIRDKDLPQETNQARALHFSKGCYLGQEIVERIRSRGAVHRTFGGFIVTGDLPSAGAALFTSDPARPIGELTSVVHTGEVTLALGYARREALDGRVPLHYAGGTVEPTSLPYRHPRP